MLVYYFQSAVCDQFDEFVFFEWWQINVRWIYQLI
jgi:hypothetical protein